MNNLSRSLLAAVAAAFLAIVIPTIAAMAGEQAASRFGGHVHALAISPKTNELFIGARPVYRSSDGGKTWRAIEGIPKAEARANITSIAIDASDPNVMYVTGHGVGVAKSSDGGQTWKEASAGLGGMATEGFTIDAKDPQTLYVWVLSKGLYRSRDAGASWQRVDDGPKQQEIRSLASVGLPTGMGGIWLYAGLDTGLMKSPDCFCGWDRLANAGLPADSRVYSVAVDPTNPKVLYAGLRQGVFKSTDGAQSWSHVTDQAEDAVVAVSPSNPSEVYAIGSNGALLSSKDAGGTWTKVEQQS